MTPEINSYRVHSLIILYN